MGIRRGCEFRLGGGAAAWRRRFEAAMRAAGQDRRGDTISRLRIAGAHRRRTRRDGLVPATGPRQTADRANHRAVPITGPSQPPGLEDPVSAVGPRARAPSRRRAGSLVGRPARGPAHASLAHRRSGVDECPGDGVIKSHQGRSNYRCLRGFPEEPQTLAVINRALRPRLSEGLARGEKTGTCLPPTAAPNPPSPLVATLRSSAPAVLSSPGVGP